MSDHFSQRPASDEFFTYYETYVSKVPTGSVLEVLKDQGVSTMALLATVPPQRETFRYAPGKWSVREVVCHCVDTEREFAYRAMRFARGSAYPLPSFDQDEMIAGADVSGRMLASLADEWTGLRSANVALFGSFKEEDLDRSGIASGYRFSVRSLLYIIAGHEKHHMDVLHERYL